MHRNWLQIGERELHNVESNVFLSARKSGKSSFSTTQLMSTPAYHENISRRSRYKIVSLLDGHLCQCLAEFQFVVSVESKELTGERCRSLVIVLVSFG